MNMKHPKDIRIEILKMTQEELGRAVSRTQASVSEWELRGSFPLGVQAKVRHLGKVKLGDDWNDDWLFAPIEEPAQ